MRSLDVTTPVMRAMRANLNTGALLLPACNLMAGAPEIVEKMYEAQLVQFVLGLLSGGLESCDDPAALKAHGVQLLKTLAQDVRLGPTIQAILDEDREWEHYKAQDHALFLAPGSNGGLLTGPSGGRVGLLT